MPTLLAAVLAIGVTAAGPPRTKVAVLDIAGPEDVRAKAQLLTPVVVNAFAKVARLQVISSQDIAATLGLARERELLGCSEENCLAEMGGALGVSYIVTGSLGHLGSRYRLDFRLVKAENGGIAGSAGDFIAGRDDALADATVRLADALVKQLAQLTAPEDGTGLAQALVPTETAAPRAPSRTGAYVWWASSGALLIGAIAMTLVTQSTFDDVSHHTTDPQRQSKADSLQWKGPMADGLWAATLATAGVGAYWYFTATPSSSNGQVGVGGRF